MLSFIWRSQNLDAFGLSNDEGAHLMWARLAGEGYPLYSETQAVQSPLFLETVRLAFYLGGRTIQTGRLAVLLGFVLLAVALSWLAFRAGGWAAAISAIFLLGISPLIFTFSRLVMAEVPATGLAVSSVALFFLFLDRSHKGWLFASGLALGLSFITKALNPFVAVPIGLLLLIHSETKKSFILDGVLWGVAVLLPVVAIFFIYDPSAIYEQLFAFRGILREAVPGSWPETWGQFKLFATTHWSFWLLALGGVTLAIEQSYKNGEVTGLNLAGFVNCLRGLTPGSNLAGFVNCLRGLTPGLNLAGFKNLRGLKLVLVWFVWLIAGVGMLAWHTPLFPHHFIALLPPLILLGSGFIATLRRFSDSPLGSLILLVVVVGAAFNIPAMVEANQKTAAIVTGGRETEALKLLDAVSSPNDFLMGDSQAFIFLANRSTPPPLGDVALVAIKAGLQTSDRMIGLNQEYQAPAVVQWSLRLPWLPEYLSWVEANYLARRVWDNDHIIYFMPRFPAGQPIPNERNDRLGEAITLRGYQIEAELEDELTLKVYWQTNTPLLHRNYTIFTQLLTTNGELAAGWDSQPLSGYFPTSQWPPDEIITDIVRLPLPSDLPAGDYTLITGLYLLETLERLPASDGNDHVTLTNITLANRANQRIK